MLRKKAVQLVLSSIRHSQPSFIFAACLGVALALVAAPPRLAAQVGSWIWKGGSSALGSASSPQWGTLGVAAASNNPGARIYAVSWTGKDGKFWLFGGSSFSVDPNDLWVFDPSTSLWTWMSGTNKDAQPGSYGTLGVPSPSNIPGSRESATTWTDKDGNLWLFGGIGWENRNRGFDNNDLWKYTPSIGQWTWMGGSGSGQAGVYGTLGVPAATNMPGGREYAVTWTDANGNLWLFGGLGNDASGSGNLNDLWKYAPSTGQWTWVSGSNTADQPGNYGTLGVSASTNLPVGRNGAVTWTDTQSRLWLFGGVITNSRGPGTWSYLNDLWVFDPSTGRWTWMGGSQTLDQPGAYGTVGVAAATNMPGARANAISWTDASGSLWLFGGHEQDGGGGWGFLNDLWEYTPSTGIWTWMNGSDTVEQSGSYGTRGVAAQGNTPGARYLAVNWTDANDNLWLFGGAGVDGGGNSGNLNDLWEYEFLPKAPVPLVSPEGGTYFNKPVEVTIPAATPDTRVYYTLDGTTPTTDSAPCKSEGGCYGAIVGINQNTTLSVIATRPGYNSSDVVTNTYSFQAATPSITPPSGIYSSSQTVTISDDTQGATIYYTTDGSIPSTSSTRYTAPITVSSSETIKSIAAASGFANSDVATAVYTINIPSNPTPTLSGLSPTHTAAGGQAFTLTTSGTGFVQGSTVYWGSTALTTTYVSPTQLQAAVPSTLIASSGAVTVTVQNPAPGGGTSSTYLFEVDSSNGATYAPNFTVITATVSAGSSASYAVTFPSSVGVASVSCLNLPAGASCSYNSSTRSVTITTSAATPTGTYLITVVFTETVTTAAAWFIAPLLLLPLICMRRRMAAKGIWLAAGLCVVVVVGIVNLAGCGGGGSSSTQTPTQSQVVSSGTVSLTVQ